MPLILRGDSAIRISVYYSILLCSKMISLFSKKYQKNIIEEVSYSYIDFLSDLRENSKDQSDSAFLSKVFQEQFRKIIFDSNLDSYSTFKFYWLTLIEKLVSIMALHEEYDELKSENKEFPEKEEIENDILDFWNSGDFTLEFMEKIKSQSIIVSSKGLSKKLENQILAFYWLQISTKNYQGDNLNYTYVSEVGDSNQRIYLNDYLFFVDLFDMNISFPQINIKSINWEKKRITLLDINLKEKNLDINSFEHIILKEKFQVLLYEKTNKESYNQIVEKLKLSLEIIDIVSPNSATTLLSFTNTIIPISEKGIVSYSLQNLPGISLINLVERDFLDLLDDLTHENGHHYLNTFLNHTDLINEDDDKIYYSPWRRALRPIRGIYHATFTFFWALNLYVDLYKNISLIEEKGIYQFSPEEKEKIKLRQVEEYYMLTYCFADLNHAYEDDKITEEGMELIGHIQKLIEGHEAHIIGIEALLNKSSESNINELKKTLKDQRKKSKKILL